MGPGRGSGLEDFNAAAKKQRPSTVGEAPLPPSKQTRLVIIGAGFAGLSAARTIQGAGERIEVIVLEASSAVGGRVRSGALPSGARVELGATWFHGIQGNPLYDIAVWEGLIRDLRGDPDQSKHQVNWQVDFARPQCPELLSGHMREIAEEALERFQEGAMGLSEEAQAPDASVGAFLRRKFDEAIAAHGLSPEELAVFAESWLFREKQQRTFDGFFCADDVSAAFPWEFETLEGPNMPVPGGWQAIAQTLASPVDIRFGHRVTAIEWGSGGVSISCSNGLELEADAVLVTTSVGVLQAQHHSLFRPPLPDWKKEAISAMRLGIADKIFLEFDVDEAAATSAVPVPITSPSAAPSSIISPSAAPPHLLSSLGSTSGNPTPTGPLSASSLLSSVPGISAEEPFNMGRRGVIGLEAEAAAQAAAAVVSGRMQSLGSTATRPAKTATERSQSGSGGSRERRESGVVRRGGPPRRRKSIRTFAFLWPVAEPMALGCSGTARSMALLPGGLVHEPLPGTPFSGLPSWLYGLHSIRYCPGPCWIEPSQQEAFHTMLVGLNESQELPPQQQQPSTVSAVLWITGDAALEMEDLSDEEVQAGIVKLLHTFPAVPLPPGARLPPRVVRTRWGRDELFRGSYSYLRAGLDDGEAIDAIAQPLYCEDGVMPVVMFAGEATHRQHPGTAHGAYLSGYREANRFLAALEQQEQIASWSHQAAATGRSQEATTRRSHEAASRSAAAAASAAPAPAGVDVTMG